MGRRRRTRRGRLRLHHRRVLVGVGVALAVGMIVLGAQVLAPGSSERAVSGEVLAESRLDEPASGGEPVPASDAATAAPLVEIPDMCGTSIARARIVMGALGLAVSIVEDPTKSTELEGDDRVVTAQSPDTGEIVDAATEVVLGVPIASSETTLGAEGLVVCIDPGHQARSDPKVEAIGPDAGETKPRVSGGGQGVITGIPEHELALQISLALREELERRGVHVVMTRTSNDVNISNSERAAVANRAEADLFVRVHCDGSVDSDVSGIATLYPARNEWTAPVCGKSQEAAAVIQDGMVASTGGLSRGTVARDDVAGFNWAEMPVVLAECGFLSNPIEDRLLSSAHYQEKLAQGMADGIVEYLAGE